MATWRGLACCLCVAFTACGSSPSEFVPTIDAGLVPGPDASIDASLPPIDEDAGVVFDPCSSSPPPGYDPGDRGLVPCCSEVGASHCVPRPEVLPALAAQLRACEGGDYVCMPDSIIRGGGAYRPATCTSSLVNSPGACISKCIPLLADNPQAFLLRQDSCAGDELCVPCLNPLDQQPTGACELIDLLCSGEPDGGTVDAGTPACPHTGPPILDPATFPACSPACGGAHCVPAQLVPAGQQTLLASCEATGGGAGFCAPDRLIETGGNFVPPTCESIGGAEGRCLSTCLPDVADKAALLPRSTCAADERCAPCFDPTSADPNEPTGACTLACDSAKEPPLVLSCPYSGPPLLDPRTLPECAPACGGAHCVPGALVPAELQSLLDTCGGGFCAPDSLIVSGGNSVPQSCRSVAGAEGRCLSTCIPLVADQQELLPRDVCGTGEACVPCFDPTSSDPLAPTGACTLACDSATEPPVQLTCPWTGPPVIDPTVFPACAPACGGAHCVPAERIPTELQPMLAACEGGFCAPDDLVAAGGQAVPASCRSIAGVEGRCLSMCLPDVAERIGFLPRDTCDAGELCAPCFDPTSSDPDAPTGACSLACDEPAEPPKQLDCPWTGPPIVEASLFPQCSPACGGSRCVPASMIPEDQQDLLAACEGGFCAPEELIEAAGNFVPKSCRSVAGAEGRCLTTCLPPVAEQADVLPRDNCDVNERCVPCFDPTSSDPTAATGACSLACDSPKRPPVVLDCPWTGPPVIDPSTFPSCCAGAHCVPGSLIPEAQRDLLAPCGNGGFCAPDPIISSANNYVPPTCRSVAGVEGRCLSQCLPDVAGQPLLPQSTCGAGHKCVPCYDPTSGDPTAATGACGLGCDAPAEPATELSCPWEGPAVIVPSALPTCEPACAGAHCLPEAYVPEDQRDLLAPCTGGFCTPDPIIQAAGNFVPETCRSIAGAEGRCLSACLPAVAEQPLLPRATCGAAEKCVPCYDPTSGDPTAATGACSLATCDMPDEPPVEIECPWTGPAVLDPEILPACAPACAGAHCLPASFVPGELADMLAACPGGYCTPDSFIESGGEGVPQACRSVAGAEGRCLSRCLPDVAGQPLLPRDVCAPDERCVPCYDPTSNEPTVATGACSVASCDLPDEPPVVITCPWTGPPVIDPNLLPACSPTCGGAHCLPAEYVPADQQGLLATCPGGFCAPDPIIRAAGEYKPPRCEAFAGTGFEGRCLSPCLPIVAQQSELENSSCGGDKCAPCTDPFTGEATGACELACDAPEEPPAVFPSCCGNTALCIPRSQIPDGSEDDLLRNSCPSDAFLCVPEDIPPLGQPQDCLCLFGSCGGTCLNDCLDLPVILPSLECPSTHSCFPCVAGLPGC